MAKITITPMVGNPKRDRLTSLNGCHALFEKAEYIDGLPGNLGTSLESAIKKVLLTQDMRHHVLDDRKISLIITLEL